VSQWSEDPISIDSARTLDGLFFQRVKRSPQRPAYRFCDRDSGWLELSWGEAGQAVARWRAALVGESLNPGDRVAMVLRNCPEWVMFDIAAQSLGLVTVPLYTEDRADNAAYIIQDAAVKLLLIQDAGRWSRLAGAAGNATVLQRVVLLNGGAEAERQAAEDPRVRVAHDWLPPTAPEPPVRDGDPHALATIIYTSGTTGRPKGVMLSHHNLLSNALGGISLIRVYQEDLFLSFLPLSHALERTAGCYLPMMTGSCVAFARSVNQFAEDLLTIRPTLMIAVPRVFERVHARITEQLSKRPALARWLFQLTETAGWHRVQRAQGRAGWRPLLLLWPVLRRQVAGQVLNKLGGRLRATVSGGAPLPGRVARTFIGLGLPLLQGYGLTETSPVIAVNPLEDNIPESVGVLLPGIQVRIGADDELQVKGPNVMLGYWNNGADTARVLTPDGWLHTGDQARITDGHVYITGRIKDILVLSNGEKVPPADMEQAIAMDPLFEQILVLGEGRSYLTALLVLNEALWTDLAQTLALDPAAPDSLKDPHLHKEILKRVRLAHLDFPGYAKIRRVTLTLEPWTVDNGLLTPTLKVKRTRVVEHYRVAIERMYALEA
jgi:long-chain acyl-CoA synthetase